MAERIFVGVAWPTPNGSLHLGHAAGCYLPADVFARYHRLAGNQVLMVSGTDQHGTPVTVRAEAEGVPPAEIADRYHAEYLDCWRRLGISFDVFTTTGTANHRRVVHDLFRGLQEHGHLEEREAPVAFCPRCDRALPDRYVEGTCPHCGSGSARGDQCPDCGRPLDPPDLGEPRCRRCGGRATLRSSSHVFLGLDRFQERLEEWVERQSHWRPNVRGVAKAWLAEGLRPRAITRDLSWGVPVPLDGYEEKRIYVWFEAVCGYLSAAVEWAERRGQPDAWRPFWEEPARHYYFLGKDNIFFHTVVWPAILLGNDLKLPDDVPANENLTLEGKPFSTSRGHAVWLPEFLDRHDPDPLRFYLALNMPETGDADFSWERFVQTNDGELVGTWGNLVHRVLTFVQRRFGGRVPSPCSSRPADLVLANAAEAALPRVGVLLAAGRFREGLREALALARQVNRYLDAQAPWKEDDADCASTVRTALAALEALKLLLAPFLPFSSARLHDLLGHGDRLEEQGWRLRQPLVGTRLPPPEPLFRKLER
ncbi:MAG TPA: methionine--tRNA ligase [Chloroflexota bacterium]|jgi:methionyl-tRNA synthetase|nr:methionine--tRNA ligase [Chloroflexota bacterium]